ncbi:DUF1003 domain-containing protein [Microbacterium nymphoidis]|uniref:DUF1003 domain-containing protein n=1 Tax=Microbacterium nymphoidis TaxID=2898586 RepID=UPI001E2EECD7|nr:DUF1003 domain-containing protein [Microbacterium nymphoidis]MCD2496936.1 DUF1003 domain-containing protein [Microbacterium nymphoidis]
MARDNALDSPARRGRAQPKQSRDRFGRFTEWIARAMGTPTFLALLTLFCVAWIAWNSLMPAGVRFDEVSNGFTALTLVLSLQASYAAPLILLAQNRQDDRDRVQIEQDRQRAERNLADTEYLAREVVALRMAMTDLVEQSLSRDVLRQELRTLLAELDDRAALETGERPATDGGAAKKESR